MVFLDTDVMVNFLRKEPNAVSLIKKLKEEEEPLKTTTINEFELWKGAYRKKTEESHNSVKNLLSELEISDLTSVASKKAAEIFETLLPISIVIIMRAGFALSFATCCISDFRVFTRWRRCMRLMERSAASAAEKYPASTRKSPNSSNSSCMCWFRPNCFYSL